MKCLSFWNLEYAKKVLDKVGLRYFAELCFNTLLKYPKFYTCILTEYSVIDRIENSELFRAPYLKVPLSIKYIEKIVNY